jgi:hypothetical protein
LVAGGFGSPSAGLLQPDTPSTSIATSESEMTAGKVGFTAEFMDEIMKGKRG